MSEPDQMQHPRAHRCAFHTHELPVVPLQRLHAAVYLTTMLCELRFRSLPDVYAAIVGQLTDTWVKQTCAKMSTHDFFTSCTRRMLTSFSLVPSS